MLAGIPGLTFAIGIYLPLATQTAIFVGGLIRWWVDGRTSLDPKIAAPGAGGTHHGDRYTSTDKTDASYAGLARLGDR